MMSFGRRLSLGVFVLAIALTFGTRCQAAPQSAEPADRFVDSLGVNVHLHYSDTIYWDFPKLKAALKDLGVRHLRDGLVYNGRNEYYERHKELAASGIRTTFIVSGDMGHLAEQVARLGPAIEAVEGPNEVDLNHWKPADARAYQKRLWETVKQNPDLRHLPVVGLSCCNIKFGGEMGDLSAWLDFGNCHPYPGGWFPENDCNWMHADLPWGFAIARAACGTKSVEVTETGYTNAIHHSGGHVPVSETLSGIYLPRLMLNCFRNKVHRTFWYELFNLKPDAEQKDVERNFGLYKADGVTPKPAGRALAHLAQLLADPGPVFKPGSLAFTLSNAKAQTVLLEKRNGTLWLAVWLPNSLWDNSRPFGQKHEVDPTEAPCMLGFPAAPRRITRHADLDRLQVTTENLTPGTSVKLMISERVTLVEVQPVAASH